MRGLVGGAAVDEWEEVDSIGRGVDANADWAAAEKLFLNARWIVSNTGDRGYELDPADRADNGVPKSFPAKLTKLLYARFAASRPAPTLFPCELIEGNGDRLKALTLDLAASWDLPARLSSLARRRLRVGQFAGRPHRLGAVGARGRGRRALFAVGGREPAWPDDAVPPPERRRHRRSQTLRAAEAVHPQSRPHLSRASCGAGAAARRTKPCAWLLADPATLAELNDLYDREVLPVFDGLGMGEEARAYRASVIERFRNPFLDHRLADIFTNHAAKKQRRFGGLVALAEQHGIVVAQPRLKAALAA